MACGNYSDENTDDVYVVNDKTLQVFYVRGVEFEGKTYYTKGNVHSPDLTSINTPKTVNPILYTGMIPVVWNGSNWVEVENPDPNPLDNINTYDEWYDYTTGMLANVKLQDGSMYVWIPTSATEGFWVAKYEASKNVNGEVQVVQGGTVWTGADGDIIAKCKNIASLPNSGLDSEEVNTNRISEAQKVIVRSNISNTQYSVMEGTSSTPITVSSDLINRPVITGIASEFAKVIPTPSAWEAEVKETREGNIPIPTGYYYVGGTKSTGLKISNEAKDENAGDKEEYEGTIFNWIIESNSNSSNYLNSSIRESIESYGGYYMNINTFVEYAEGIFSNLYSGKLMITGNCEIWDTDDLCYFRDAVNGGHTFEGKTVYLMQDIDLSTVCSAIKGSWVPIGNYAANTSLTFAGTFNGNDYEISNIYINSSNDYQGLFGFLDINGTIKNVSILGEITGVKYVGGIAGAR